MGSSFYICHTTPLEEVFKTAWHQQKDIALHKKTEGHCCLVLTSSSILFVNRHSTKKNISTKKLCLDWTKFL